MKILFTATGYWIENPIYFASPKDIMLYFKNGLITHEVFFETFATVEDLQSLQWVFEDVDPSENISIRYNGEAKNIDLLFGENSFSGWENFGDDEGVEELFSFLSEKQLIKQDINLVGQWLNHPDRKGVVSINELEKRVGCPRSTLGQWLTGKRELPQKWEKPLLQQIEKLDFSNGC